MTKQRIRFILFMIAALLLAGCDGTLPAAFSLATPWVEPTYPVTATAEDIISINLPTENAGFAAQSIPPQATPVPSADMKPAEPLAASAGMAPNQACDLVSPGKPFDVTVPDGTRYVPGETFSKTWRLVNNGSCTWTRDYSVVWFSGDPIGVDDQWNFTSEVAPGESVDVTVDMIAPTQTGDFQSNWKIRNSDGELFGLGPNGDAPFWVSIQVRAENTATAPVEPTPTPTLAVYISGIINLVERDTLDLDTGKMNQQDDADLRYEINGGGEIQLVPLNGAGISLFGDQEPVEEECQSANLRVVPMPLEGAETGVYICYRTTQGLPGFAHVISIGEEGHLLALDYITWTVP